MKIISLLFLICLLPVLADDKNDDLKFYKNIYPELASISTIAIDDPIDENKINNKLIKVLDSNKKLLGCLRDIVTSTGCNDGCLPVIFTLFYDEASTFIKLQSKAGLTKKDHEPFTDEDYLKLEMIMVKSPKIFDTVAHPKLMVDAVTGATLKIYKDLVVQRSAYTTLRVSRYFNHTNSIVKNYCK